MAESGGKEESKEPKKKSTEESLEELFIKISQGDVNAMSRLSDELKYLPDEEQNKLFRGLLEKQKAKDGGDLSPDKIALKELLCFYLKDCEQEAISFFHLAAKENNAVAQYFFWMMHRYSLYGVPEDFGKAFEWIQKAAEQGYTLAQNGVGFSYCYGYYGFPQDYGKGLEWYQKSAEQGNDDAQHILGVKYCHDDRGVPQDYGKACEWYRKAVEQGNDLAEIQIKELYAKSKTNAVLSADTKSMIIYHTAMSLAFAEAKLLPDDLKINFKKLFTLTNRQLLIDLISRDFLNEKTKLPIRESDTAKKLTKWLGAELTDNILKDLLGEIAVKKHVLLEGGLHSAVTTHILSILFGKPMLDSVEPESKKLEQRVLIRKIEDVKKEHPEGNFIAAKQYEANCRDIRKPDWERKNNYKEAIKHYKMAMEKGHAKASYFLGKLYEMKETILHGLAKADLLEAKKCYEIAEEKGDKDVKKSAQECLDNLKKENRGLFEESKPPTPKPK